jgi:hypothetical protein
LENIVIQSGIADSAITARDVLYAPTSGHIALARADALATSKVIGIAVEDISSSATGLYAVVGAVTSTGWGLTTNAIYYLSPTVAGGITSTAPTTIGQYVVPVGKASASSVLSFIPQESTLL